MMAKASVTRVIMRTIRGFLSAVLIGAFTLTLVGAAPAAQAAPVGQVFDRGPGGERYVALGDSAAAGPLIRPQRTDPASCQRSEKNFATLTAQALNVRAFTDVTCSAAKFGDLTAAQNDNPPQLDALNGETTLVTLGPLGANDVGLVPATVGCLVPGCKERDGTSIQESIEQLRPVVAGALAAVKSKAPNARVVVVGYGQYLPPGACYPTQPITASDGDYIQGLVDQLDRVLGDAAEGAGATFADLRSTPDALEHTTCAPIGQRWLDGLAVTSLDGGLPFHPTSLGMAAFAGTVTKAARVVTTPPNPDAKANVVVQCASKGKIRVRLTKSSGVSSMVVKLGKHEVGRDTRAPFVVTVGPKAIRKFKGRIRVTVRSGTPKQIFVKKRRRCH